MAKLEALRRRGTFISSQTWDIWGKRGGDGDDCEAITKPECCYGELLAYKGIGKGSQLAKDPKTLPPSLSLVNPLLKSLEIQLRRIYHHPDATPAETRMDFGGFLYVNLPGFMNLPAASFKYLLSLSRPKFFVSRPTWRRNWGACRPSKPGSPVLFREISDKTPSLLLYLLKALFVGR